MEKQTEYDRIEKRARTRKRVGNTVTYTLLTFWAVMVLFPFYWMVLSSVKSYSSYNGDMFRAFSRCPRRFRTMSTRSQLYRWQDTLPTR